MTSLMLATCQNGNRLIQQRHVLLKSLNERDSFLVCEEFLRSLTAFSLGFDWYRIVQAAKAATKLSCLLPST